MNRHTFIKACLVSILLMGAGQVYANDWGSYNCGDGWGPTKGEPPAYPRRARQLGITGYIIMSFSVNPDGTVGDIAVKDANPAKAFVRAATRAVESLEFPPCMAGGLATKVSDVSIKYDFNLEG